MLGSAGTSDKNKETETKIFVKFCKTLWIQKNSPNTCLTSVGPDPNCIKKFIGHYCLLENIHCFKRLEKDIV